jgi:hypothetical protein
MFKTGFSAGLQIWLIFLLILFALQYPPLFSIVIGAIAGLAGGIVTEFLQSENQLAPSTDRDRESESPWQRRWRSIQEVQQRRVENRRARQRGWYGQRPKPRTRRKL